MEEARVKPRSTHQILSLSAHCVVVMCLDSLSETYFEVTRASSFVRPFPSTTAPSVQGGRQEDLDSSLETWAKRFGGWEMRCTGLAVQFVVGCSSAFDYRRQRRSSWGFPCLTRGIGTRDRDLAECYSSWSENRSTC